MYLFFFLLSLVHIILGLLPSFQSSSLMMMGIGGLFATCFLYHRLKHTCSNENAMREHLIKHYDERSLLIENKACTATFLCSLFLMVFLVDVCELLDYRLLSVLFIGIEAAELVLLAFFKSFYKKRF